MGGPAVQVAVPAATSAASGEAPAPAKDTVICPKCGTSNQKNFKFCGGCGTPLRGLAPAGPVPVPVPVPAPAPAAAPAPVPGPATAAKRGLLVLIRPDGSEGETFVLGDTTTIGREAGGLFASDSYLSPRHATFTFGPGGLEVKDEGSLNGVYIRIPADTPTELADRQIFRIGQEIIRFERLQPRPPKDGVEILGSPSTGLIGRICLVVGRETTGNCYAVPATGMYLGRERGDILFPDDGYVSGLHCRLHEEAGRVVLTDVGSSNGTFLRVIAPTVVPSGSLLLIGQQLFRVEY
jgi:pSer/pThr/pTyr-binding forkhead associated (FHA) protein